MGALFSRLKNWGTTETVVSVDLNAEFDNILTNLVPLQFDDYSLTVGQMQTQTDPGEVGTESQATSLAGELARIRFVLQEIKGSAQTYWYQSSTFSLTSLGAAVGGGIPNNKIDSGRVRTLSSQPIFLVPANTTNTVTLKATAVPLVYSVAGVSHTVSADTTLTGLSTAPTSNNTCLVNDPGLTGTNDSKTVGEYGSSLTVDSMGSSVSALVGHVAAFKTGNEYFIARVFSATKLDNIYRGYFFDSSDAPIPRVTISDDDTITLMKLAWVFLTATGTLLVSYGEPRVSHDQPLTPNPLDYWFDVTNNIWKSYNGAAFVDSTATLIGCCVQNSTATVAARSFDFFKSFSSECTVNAMEIFAGNEVRGRDRDPVCSVYGTLIRYEKDTPRWVMDTDLDSGVSEAANTLYHLYATELGDSVISNIAPYDRPDLRGLYHPHQAWRCVGQFHNNAAQDAEALICYQDRREKNYAITTAVSGNVLTTKLHAPPNLPFKIHSATAPGESANGAVLPETSLLTAASGDTLGSLSGIAFMAFPHAVFTAGRAELGIGGTIFDSATTVTTVALGGSATDISTLYTKLGRTSTPVLCIGRAQFTEGTAGVWATAASYVSNNFGQSVVSKVFTGNGTLVAPAGVYGMWAEGCGGGGGGGGGAGSDNATPLNGGGGGGGAGATARTVYLNISPGETLTMAIGAAGSAGSAGAASSNGGAAGNGGDSTITGGTSGLLATFRGAIGGTGGTTLSPTGAGGTCTNTTVSNAAGGAGGAANGASGANGQGGPYAAGGTGGAATGNSGGGGGGGAGTAAGGAGGNGVAAAGAGGAGVAGPLNTGAGGGGGGGHSSTNTAGGGAGSTGGSGNIRLYWVTPA